MNRDYDEQDDKKFINVVSFFIGFLAGGLFAVWLTLLLYKLLS